MAAEAAAGHAASVRARLRAYRECPSVDQLRRIAEEIAAAGDPGTADQAGASLAWLREQGEMAARTSAGHVRDGGPLADWTVRDLFKLRRALTQIGVSCDGWEVSESEIASSLLRYAREQFGHAVRRMSPRSGWQVFELWGEGCIPGLDLVAAGARDVVTGYAVRHLRDEISGDHQGTGPDTLEKLRAMLPHLDQAALAALRAGGIPTDEAGIEHAAQVCKVRGFWQRRHRDGKVDHVRLAFVCEPILAENSIRASEIGATSEEIWAAARAWAAGQVRRIQAGDYDALGDLTTFTRWSGLGHEPFGITSGQVGLWEHAQARERWILAQDGDGEAAFDVICHCVDRPGSWELVTGLPGAQVRPRLQAVIEGYATRLRTQVETASAPAWAMPLFEKLRDFMFLVREVNEHAVRHGGKPLADLPWKPEPGEWREFCDRYLG
jgi:hypothetical protein